MPMLPTYHPCIPSRERILAYGAEGTGKSTITCDLMRRLPDAHFHVLDIDYTENYERLIYGEYPDVAARGNYTLHELEPSNWKGIVRATEETVPRVGPDDWFVVDSMTHLWTAAQGWFTETVFGKDPEDHLIDRRMELEEKRARAKNSRNAKSSGDEGDGSLKVLGAFEGDTDWQVINAQYRMWMRLYKQVRGHVLLTAEADDISKRDDDSIKERFRMHGEKPRGQKQLGFMPHTVLHMEKRSVTGKSTWRMTTVKDRARAEVAAKTIDAGFTQDYLRDVAGWKMTVVEVGEVVM